MLQGVERDRAVIPKIMIPRLLLLNIKRTLNVLNNPILSDLVVVYSYCIRILIPKYTPKYLVFFFLVFRDYLCFSFLHNLVYS